MRRRRGSLTYIKSEHFLNEVLSAYANNIKKEEETNSRRSRRRRRRDLNWHRAKANIS